MGYFIEGPDVPATFKIKQYLDSKPWGHIGLSRRVVYPIKQPHDALPWHPIGAMRLKGLKSQEKAQIAALPK